MNKGIIFRYPRIPNAEAKVTYTSDMWDTPAANRPDFQRMIAALRRAPGTVVVAVGPEVFGTTIEHWQAAREAVQAAGGSLVVLADTQEAEVRALFEDPRIRALVD